MNIRQLNNVDSALFYGNVPARCVHITFTLTDTFGEPVDVWDSETGERIYGCVKVVTDTHGRFAVNLWPNDRGNIPTRWKSEIDEVESSAFLGLMPSGTAPLTWYQFFTGNFSGTPGSGLIDDQGNIDSLGNIDSI